MSAPGPSFWPSWPPAPSGSCTASSGPQRSGADGLSLLLLVVVYGGVFGCIWVLEHKHKSPKGHIVISGKAALVAVVMAAMVFAVSNLLFLGDREVDMSVYYIRTLVDICGVLILTIQHEQLREAALHSELAAMDEVLHRQYEQYKRSKEGIRLINSRYHELKIQIADIRAERDRPSRTRLWPGWRAASGSMRPRTRPATRYWIPC